ncbi:dUTPase [Parapoxvirus red deer/HL953]|uniref:Deoxyuridine 5'-triphosphate nucleotidohydrolase n=1 Tax=Parapoxvirus red deer/HL953 TaxID=1579460 RepID=A0A0A7MBY7_9POXV|nr:dUTPase [Parapoxvirus red deer/HL953]AIZ77257.1 putative dUTPase [Parapoxvirus red deer/HL953]
MLRVARLSQNAIIPTRGSEQAAGYDLYSAYDYTLPPMGRAVVLTDLQIHPPYGCYGRVAPRSGLAVNNFVDVGAGVVDPDFRGNLGVVLFNFGQETFVVRRGDRVAQLICECFCRPCIMEVEGMPSTTRGSSGFGSTGVRSAEQVPVTAPTPVLQHPQQAYSHTLAQYTQPPQFQQQSYLPPQQYQQPQYPYHQTPYQHPQCPPQSPHQYLHPMMLPPTPVQNHHTQKQPQNPSVMPLQHDTPQCTAPQSGYFGLPHQPLQQQQQQLGECSATDTFRSQQNISRGTRSSLDGMQSPRKMPSFHSRFQAHDNSILMRDRHESPTRSGDTSTVTKTSQTPQQPQQTPQATPKKQLQPQTPRKSMAHPSPVHTEKPSDKECSCSDITQKKQEPKEPIIFRPHPDLDQEDDDADKKTKRAPTAPSPTTSTIASSQRRMTVSSPIFELFSQSTHRPVSFGQRSLDSQNPWSLGQTSPRAAAPVRGTLGSLSVVDGEVGDAVCDA